MAAFPWSILGGAANTVLGQFNRKEDQRRQDSSLQRMVADAKLAGISPLAALGGSGASSYASPVGSSVSGSTIGDGLASMGARAKPNALQTENATLQNDLLRAQIDAINSDTIREATSRSTIAANSAARQDEIGSLVELVRDPRTGETGYMWNPDYAMELGELATMKGQWEFGKTPGAPRLPKDPPTPSLPSRARWGTQ